MDLEITGRVFPPGWMKWDTSEMYDSVVLLVLVRMQQWLRFGHSSRPLPLPSTLGRLLLTNYYYLLLYGALTTTDSTLSSLLFPLFISSLSLSSSFFHLSTFSPFLSRNPPLRQRWYQSSTSHLSWFFAATYPRRCALSLHQDSIIDDPEIITVSLPARHLFSFLFLPGFTTPSSVPDRSQSRRIYLDARLIVYVTQKII